MSVLRSDTRIHRAARRVEIRQSRISIRVASLQSSPWSTAIYGDSGQGLDDLKTSIQERGILVPLVVRALPRRGRWEILSGHRRWSCARELGLLEVPCEVRDVSEEADCKRLILEYNRQRRKTFSQLMREADCLEELLSPEARRRQRRNLRGGGQRLGSTSDDSGDVERRISDARCTPAAEMNDESRAEQRGRTDATIARQIGIGGKDVYRQARAIWKTAAAGDIRAKQSVNQLDDGTKTINAAYKDLRRRDRFTTGFRPTPYDVWAFRHDRAFGIPHPGSIPPGIIAHAVHYFSAPGGLVVDPMAGGGTTLDVCQGMGRRCLAYDVCPSRPDIRPHDIRDGFPTEAGDCDLIFCDPPYHTMLASSYTTESVSSLSLTDWMSFLNRLSQDAFAALRPGGHFALLLAAQTEKDLPAGQGYIDHAFLGYAAAVSAGFAPERRISCPMNGGYRPQQVRQARIEGRLLGQVRDLLILRKPRYPETDPAARQLTAGPTIPNAGRD